MQRSVRPGESALKVASWRVAQVQIREGILWTPTTLLHLSARWPYSLYPLRPGALDVRVLDHPEDEG